MANREIYRTISKLWLLNYSIAIIIITLLLSCSLATETKEGTTQNVTLIENNSTAQQPVAEALIRYRRQPPRTVVKHIIRPKRFKIKQVKRPQLKYRFAEPPPTHYSRKPMIFKKPTFGSLVYEDFSHMNVESADFDLPPSSYEAQSMELDLYNHHEPSIQAASYKEVHKPSVYTYTEPEIRYKEPPYSEYRIPEITFKQTTKTPVTYSYKAVQPRKPHTNYGVPKDFLYTTGYNKASDSKYTFEVKPNKPAYTEIEQPHYIVHFKKEDKFNKSPTKELSHIPATTYGVPELHVPATGSNDYNKYLVDEHKSPHASPAPAKTITYHFAEPPEPEPSVEITYSPSYEINIPSPQENTYNNVDKRVPEQHASPPKHTSSRSKGHPKPEDSLRQYVSPSNSYERSPQENYEETPYSHQEFSGTNQPASYQPAPPRHHNIDEHLPETKELPINFNQKQPPYDYPKSSYEVPIYDHIPFDASNQEEREIYPPNSHQEPPNAQSPPNNISLHNDLDSLSQGGSSTLSTIKHILDVPELEEAFEKENRKKFSNTQEPDVNESQRFENIKSQNKIIENYTKGAWDPMKIRTKPTMRMTSNIPATTKNKRYNYKQKRINMTSRTARTSTTPTTTTTTEAPAKVEIISIEKSRSKSYYNGMTPTPKFYNTHFMRNRFKFENVETSTTSRPQIKSSSENEFSKRTTQNIFDTTIFKSPINDREIYRDLPKNHKPF